MKQLICEMCGSTDLVKDNGIFVCQACGAKYSVEEAKKMMIDGTVDVKGTVKIDKTAEIENLYNLAERVLSTSDINKASEYTDKILEIDPNNYLGWKLKTKIEFYIASLKQSSIQTAIKCAQMAYSCASEKEKEDLKTFVSIMTAVVANSYISNALNSEDDVDFMNVSDLIVDKYFDSFKNVTISFLKDFYDASAVQQFMDGYVDSIIQLTGDINKKRPCVMSWNFNIEILKYLLSIASKERKVNIYNFICLTFILIIDQRLDDNSATDLNKYVSDLFKYIEQAEKQDIVLDKKIKDYISEKKLSKPSTQNTGIQHNSTETKKGCYVATCVYGSYDCPEVWTLRRYRDYKLSETWYGRIFIKIYYTISPTIIEWFGDTKIFNRFWKKKLNKIVKILNNQGFENTEYNDKI